MSEAPISQNIPKTLEKPDRKKTKDLKILSNFIFIFCRENHHVAHKSSFFFADDRLLQDISSDNFILCQECQDLLNYSTTRLLICPYDPKPMCKKCDTQCYTPANQEKIREVMKFSGLYLIKHGRLDLIIHYLF